MNYIKFRIYLLIIIVGNITSFQKKYFQRIKYMYITFRNSHLFDTYDKMYLSIFPFNFQSRYLHFFYLSQSYIWSAVAISYLYQIVWGTNQIFEVLLHGLEYFLLHCHYEADIIPGIHLAQVFCGFQRNTVIEYMTLCKKIFSEKALREIYISFLNAL